MLDRPANDIIYILYCRLATLKKYKRINFRVILLHWYNPLLQNIENIHTHIHRHTHPHTHAQKHTSQAKQFPDNHTLRNKIFLNKQERKNP